MSSSSNSSSSRGRKRRRKKRKLHHHPISTLRRLYGNLRPPHAHIHTQCGPPVGAVQQRNAVTLWVRRKRNSFCCYFFAKTNVKKKPAERRQAVFN